VTLQEQSEPPECYQHPNGSDPNQEIPLMARAATIPITPSLPRALPLAVQEKIEAAIEAHLDAVTAMTKFLDQHEGDLDLEDGGDDEPSLGARSCVGYCGDMGASPAITWDQSNWGSGIGDDRELADDREEGGDEDARGGVI
jgi:hypothetical protein